MFLLSMPSPINIGRPKTARRNRARAFHGAGCAAFRRAHQRIGSGDGGRGSESHEESCGNRSYDAGGSRNEMAFARDVADRVIFMDEGVIV